VIGGPHATLLPDEALQHADAVVAGEGELVWPRVLSDFEQGKLAGIYRSCALPDLQNMPAPRWDLIKGRGVWKGRHDRDAGLPLRVRVLHHPCDVSAAHALPPDTVAGRGDPAHARQSAHPLGR
jgi:radical SAM superfamily enzyme YgiQ (UPF0313 family)